MEDTQRVSILINQQYLAHEWHDQQYVQFLPQRLRAVLLLFHLEFHQRILYYKNAALSKSL
jgi:hypothetical protein